MKRGIAFGVAVALAFAATVIGAFGVLVESAIRSHGALDRYAPAVAVVSGKQSISVPRGNNETETRPLVERNRPPLSAAAALRGVPGVEDVVADFSLPVVAVSPASAGTPGTPMLTGHGWDSAALVSAGAAGSTGSTGSTAAAGSTVLSSPSTGQAPAGAHDVVLDPIAAEELNARTGSRVALQIDGAPETYRVTGVTAGSSTTSKGTLYFTQQRAETLSGHPGRADALVVLARPGAAVSVSALRQAAPGLEVVTGAARGDVENPAVQAGREDAIGSYASLGGVALLIAILVVTGLLELSVRDRARSLAVMRAVGATPRQVRGVIVREALRLSVPSALAGGAAALGVGALLESVLSSQHALPDGFELFLGPLPPAAAALVTIIAAVGSAWLSSRRVSRIRPVEALGETAAEPTRQSRWRMITGIVFLLLGAGMLAVTFTAGGQTAAASISGLVVSLIWAVALLGPWIARAGVGVLGAPLRRLFPVSGGLATSAARAAAIRMAAVITPVALALSFGATQLFAATTATHATSYQAIDGLRAGQVLVSSGPGIPHAAYDAVRATPGAGGVTAVKRTTVVMRVRALGDATPQSLAAQGVEGAVTTDLDPKVTAGSLAELSGTGTVALSSMVAGGAKPGDTQQLWLGDGTSVTLRVVALYDRGLGFGDVLLPRALVAAHSTTPLDDYVLASGGADLSGVSRQFAGVHTADRGQYGESLTATARHQALVNLVGVLAIAGFVLIGVVTTLAVATASRRRELTLLRLIGTTRSQLLRALRLETVLILGTGVLAGAAVAGVSLVAFAGGVTGLPMLTVSPTFCAAILGAVVLPAGAAIMLPARAMLRRRSPRIGE